MPADRQPGERVAMAFACSGACPRPRRRAPARRGAGRALRRASISASPVRPIRQKPASAISSSARARLTTRTQGTVSSAPLAALASAPGFRRRVPVLGDQAERVEGRRRAQDRADIVRIGDLVEHDQGPPVLGPVEQIGEQDVVEPLDLGDHALVRRVARHQPAEIGDVGIGDRDRGGRCRSAAAASRVTQRRTMSRSGLASAAATACRPQKRGRFSALVAWRALRRIAVPLARGAVRWQARVDRLGPFRQGSRLPI